MSCNMCCLQSVYKHLHPLPPSLPECGSPRVTPTLSGALRLFSIPPIILRNSKNAPKNFQDNYSVTTNEKPLDFAVGDLVYFVGYEGPSDRNRIGVVVDIKTGESHFPLYVVHWIKDKLQSTHTAAHIDLLYTTDIIDNEVSPKSLLHLKDRVNDRGEGD